VRAHRLAGPICIHPEQAVGWPVAKRRSSELAEVVGPDEAVRQASSDWPEAVPWPMGFLLDRLRRRLAETHGAGLRLSRPNPSADKPTADVVRRRLPAPPTSAGPQRKPVSTSTKPRTGSGRSSGTTTRPQRKRSRRTPPPATARNSGDRAHDSARITLRSGRGRLLTSRNRSRSHHTAPASETSRRWRCSAPTRTGAGLS
jgi:hypothetical protein